MSFKLISSLTLSLLALAATAAPQGSSTPPDCPSEDGTTVTTSTGAQYIIECGVDHAAGDIASTQIASGLLTDCMAACDVQPHCIDVSMVGQSCYMKESVGAASQASHVRGARLVSQADIDNRSQALGDTPTCPSWDGKTWISANGSQFKIECGVEHPGNDLSMVQVNDLAACATACDNNPVCVTAVMSGVACYMKSSAATSQPGSGLVGARLLAKLCKSN